MSNIKKYRYFGFTLIELLAVIVILAIIALVTTPMVLNIVEESRKSSVTRSAEGILKSAKNYYMQNEIKGNLINNEIDLTSDVLEYDGDKPEKGTITFDEKGNTSLLMYIRGYCITKEYNGYITTEKKEKNKCIIPILYKDIVLNGADPVLDSGMTPVLIDDDGTVKKADIYKKWYDYENKRWANAVLVSSDVRDSYNGEDPIPEEKILAYFVWIPRYKYTMPSEKENPINIVFENKNTGKSTGNATETYYYTHPAFTFGDISVDGIRIIPKVASLRYNDVSNMFYVSRSISKDENIFGIDKEKANTHMMKNTEWGAVAYLTHSKYGINGEVRINNNSSYITGCGANEHNKIESSSCEMEYGSVSSYPQSTTGNITGIFDMVGGAFEYVMGVQYNGIANTILSVSNSGFINQSVLTNINDKYIDKYAYGTTYNDETAYNRRILGDATKETKGWYGDFAGFIESNNPWFTRCGRHTNSDYIGTFYFSRGSGKSNSSYSFRPIVSIIK